MRVSGPHRRRDRGSETDWRPSVAAGGSVGRPATTAQSVSAQLSPARASGRNIASQNSAHVVKRVFRAHSRCGPGKVSYQKLESTKRAD